MKTITNALCAALLGLAPFVTMAADTGAAAAGAQPAAGSVASGEKLFARNCRICHGPPFTGYFMLSRRLGEEQAVLEARGRIEPAYVRLVVRNGLNSMPHIGRGSVSDAELTDIIAYLNRGAAVGAAGK